MKGSNVVILLSFLTIVLALMAAAAGLLWPDSGYSFSFTTVQGQVIQIYGHGLYRFDTPMIATAFKMADVITLVFVIPLSVIALLRYGCGSLRGGILLAGTLAYFLYDYSVRAFGATYNNFLLFYVAILALSLFALVMTLMSFDVSILPAHFSSGLPHRGIGIFLIVAGSALLLTRLTFSIIPAILQGQAPPDMWSNATVITLVIDMGITAPVLIVTGAMLLQRHSMSYLLASTLLVFTVLLGINLTASSVAQIMAGLIGIGQFIEMSLAFLILTLFAIGFTGVMFCKLKAATAITQLATGQPIRA